VAAGNAPPSRLIASWILVSLVSCARAAERTRGDSETIVLSILQLNVGLRRSWEYGPRPGICDADGDRRNDSPEKKEQTGQMRGDYDGKARWI